MTDAQLAVALYRLIADPEMEPEGVTVAHLCVTLSDVVISRVIQALAEMAAYGAIRAERKKGDIYWFAVAYEATE